MTTTNVILSGILILMFAIFITNCALIAFMEEKKPHTIRCYGANMERIFCPEKGE